MGRLTPTPVLLLAVAAAFAAAAPAKPKDASASPKADVTVGPESDGKAVSLRLGQVLAVKLPGNPTTGYQWVLGRIEGEAVTSVGEVAYQAPKPGKIRVVGAGGTYVAAFRAAKDGVSTVHMEYKRSWEREPGKTFALTVEVKSGKKRGP